MRALATSLQAWFTDRLISERNASPHTIASYRRHDPALLTYASHKLGVEPSSLEHPVTDFTGLSRLVATEISCGAAPPSRTVRNRFGNARLAWADSALATSRIG